MKNLIQTSLVIAALLSLSASANALLPIAQVPEPSSLGLLGLGLAIIGLIGRRK